MRVKFWTLGLLIFVGGALSRNYKPRTQLTFSPTSRGYTNVLVAINSNVNEADCVQVVQEVKNTFSETSSLLYSATGGAAHFSSVKILLPSGRCNSVNGIIETQSAADSYATADFKVTESHPLVNQGMPWTRQYRGCSFGAEDVFIPATKFLLDSGLTLREKSGILLQEWAKFRYGVFSEFSYHDDQLYNSCYKNSRGEGLLSSCSSTQLPSLFQGEGNCRAEVEANKEELLTRVRDDTDASSLMFLPHLSSVTKFCTNETHNSQAPNKQNIFCGGQSVNHVRETHPDFALSKTDSLHQSPPTTFQVLRHGNTDEFQRGLIILIENSTTIRQQNRLRYVKQALSSVISLLPLGQSRVGVGYFDGSLFNLNQRIPLNTDADKVSIIQSIPDVDTLIQRDRIAKGKLRQGGPNQLGDILRTTLTAISGIGLYDWNLLLISNNPSVGFIDAANQMTESFASLTVVTLDGGDPLWTTLYTSTNVRSVLSVAPNCAVQHAACSRWSSLVAEGAIEAIQPQNSNGPQWQKIGEGALPSGATSTVLIEVNGVPISGYNFFITLSQIYAPGLVRVRNPSGAECNVGTVHGYGFLVRATGCDIQTGNWSVDLTQLPSSVPSSQVTVWVEVSTSASLNILTSFGADRKAEIRPDGGLPIFSRISDASDAPVISAVVEAELFSDATVYPGLILKDDGIDPDVTQDDGVYSGILTNFSANPSFHVGRVKVTTGKSWVVASLNPINAATLDERVSGKCCGSRVPVLTTMPFPGGTLTSLIPGFRTGAAFNPGSIPPSRIGPIRVAQDDGSNIRLEFRAPGASSDQGMVDHYQSCCTYFLDGSDPSTSEISSCHQITPDCNPVEAGLTQSCVINRGSLKDNHVDSAHNPVALNCGVRGVNSMGREGQSSMGSLVVDLDSSTGREGGKSGCSSLSDDCLPISLFWGLIGCIGGLLLILLVVILCWCIYARRHHKNPDQEEVLLSTNRKRSRLQPSADVEVTPPPRTTSANNNKDSPLYNVYVNKAYITDSDGGMKLVAADGQLLPLDEKRPPAQSSSTKNPEPIYNRFTGVSIAPVPPVRRASVLDDDGSLRDDMAIFKSRPEPPPKPGRPNSHNKAATAPIPRNRVARPDSGYANHLHNNNNTDPQLSFYQKPVAPAPPSQVDIDLPVYASVNRNGRSRTPLSSPPNSGFSTFRPSSGTPRQAIPAHFGGRSKDDSFVPSSTRFAPKRYDAFPSSDSETYSDMSRSVGPPSQVPPAPPPFPPNRGGANQPPPYNPPPPPPPPQSKRTETVDDEYDDDSEHWDDEDFDFEPPGVSYA